MKLFRAIVTNWKPLTIFKKSFILDVSQNSGYASVDISVSLFLCTYSKNNNNENKWRKNSIKELPKKSMAEITRTKN